MPACSACSQQNPAGARFCMGCGNPLARACAECGADAPPQARFCMSCGAPLDVPAAAAPKAAAAAPEPARATPTATPEERRRVTVLFADLSGYTAVSERMDPESVKSLLDRSLHRLGEEVTRFGGRVDKYIGDNVMAIFGAPVAHEDDAERAVRAALGMLDAMEAINSDFGAQHGVEFELRIGVNTGEVLAGRVGESYTVIGDAVNVASRLQAAARPGSVTVGEPTYRLTAAAIDYRPLAPLELKGKAEPVAAWEALGARRVPAAPSAHPVHARLVGRRDELALLVSLFQPIQRQAPPHQVTLIRPPAA